MLGRVALELNNQAPISSAVCFVEFQADPRAVGVAANVGITLEVTNSDVFLALVKTKSPVEDAALFEQAQLNL